MICHADVMGGFQIESLAQQSIFPKLKPYCFYDLVIDVAIVRDDPIHGDMLHPYIRKRNGEDPVEYPSPEIIEILGRIRCTVLPGTGDKHCYCSSRFCAC